MAEAPDSRTRRRSSLVVATLLAAVAIWRIASGVGHYHASVAITDDPSMRELEQVSAGFEFAFAALLVLHAVGVFVIGRRAVRIDNAAAIAVGILTAVSVTAALLKVPILATPGFLGLPLLVVCGRLGYRDSEVWLSVYLGAFVGAALGYLVAIPGIDPIVGSAVVGPPVVTALVGVGVGRLVALRRRAA